MKDKLRVWHYSPYPGNVYHVPVESVEGAKKILNVIADYDLWLAGDMEKPPYAVLSQDLNEVIHEYAKWRLPVVLKDFCNAQGLEYFDEEDKEWLEWYDEETDYDIAQSMEPV